MKFNLLPFLCEAFAINPKTYKYIDKLYQKDKIKFYKSAKENEWYSHVMASEGSVEQEEYFKKTLGIILNAEEYEDDYINIIPKCWKYTYTYIENHSSYTLEDFLSAFIRKNKGIQNLSEDEINSNVIMVLLLSKDKIDQTTGMFKGVINALGFRLEHYKNENPHRVNLSHATNEKMKKIRDLKNKIFNTYGDLRQVTTPVDNEDLETYISLVDCLFDYENISLVGICNNIKITDKDIEEILYLWLLKYDENAIMEASKFLTITMRLKWFCKAYKKAKEYHFANNKETMFIELEDAQNSYNRIKTDYNVQSDQLDKSISEIEKLKKENERLKQQLKEQSQNNQELIKLREFIFNIDNIEDYQEKSIDYNKLKELKAVIIGGHSNWHNKMKQYLPNCKFISPEALNFDTNILNNTDQVFIYTNYLNHGMYYKIIDIVRQNSIELHYLKANLNLPRLKSQGSYFLKPSFILSINK